MAGENLLSPSAVDQVLALKAYQHNAGVRMLQQAMKSDDVIEEALQQIGSAPVPKAHLPTKSELPHWSSILSQLNRTGFPMMKSHEEIAQAGKDTIEALKKSSTALADGFGEISQHIAELTHKSVAANLATSKEVLGIKTPSDWVEFQSKWAGDLMASTVSQMTHFSQLSTKVINQTCEPLKTHFGATFGKMGGSI
jgi:phasin family protein